jgi:thymidylate synthase (FAD)
MGRLDVLDKGYVELIDHMGNDYRILEAARMSTGAIPKKGDKKDRKLIHYLYKNQHMSPFEMAVFTFKIKTPIFVARQWFRHRIGSFNEKSARYTEFTWEYYEPDSFRLQDTENKQGSVDDILIDAEHFDAMADLYDVEDIASSVYTYWLQKGIAKEQARQVMTVGQYTEFMWTVNLRSLLHFLELRLHPHAQKEIRVYAEAILSILHALEDEFKWTLEIFQEDIRMRWKIQETIKSIEDYKKVYGLLDTQ